MTRADLDALRRHRDEACRRADELADLFDQYPRPEIKREMEHWSRRVDQYDLTLGGLPASS